MDLVSANLLQDFPVVIEAPVAWGEMDSMRHVNNIVYFRYFESARIAYFEQCGFLTAMEETGVGPILASTRCRFRRPLTYPDTVRIGTRVMDVAEDRFTMIYCVTSVTHGTIAADGDGLIVSYDYRENRKAPLPDSVRRRIGELEQG